MSQQLRRVSDRVESQQFQTTKVHSPVPPLTSITATTTILNAIHIVLMNAGRPLTVFEIAADLKQCGRELPTGQYDVFSAIYQQLISAPKEIYGIAEVP